MSVLVSPLADPRPVVVDEAGSYVLVGGRCSRCGHALAVALPRCPRCGGASGPERFGPEGAVWSFTVVHIPTERGGEAPYVLGYIDLDDGPRILLRLDRTPGEVGARVRLAALSATGNPTGVVLP